MVVSRQWQVGREMKEGRVRGGCREEREGKGRMIAEKESTTLGEKARRRQRGRPHWPGQPFVCPAVVAFLPASQHIAPFPITRPLFFRPLGEQGLGHSGTSSPATAQPGGRGEGGH